MTASTLISIQVGRPRQLGFAGAADPLDRPWTSAIMKEEIRGPVTVGTLGIEGDGHADLTHHGGPDKAILVYAAAHYLAWRSELGTDVPAGAFGENLTVDGPSEHEVCVGDLWRIGGVVLQVTQPRQPCHNLVRRFRLPDMVARVAATARTGWYCRVIEPGVIVAGLPVDLVSRPEPHWTIERCLRIMESSRVEWLLAAELASLPGLSEAWRSTLLHRAADGARADAERTPAPRPSPSPVTSGDVLT